MELFGKVKLINPEVQVTQSFRKRELVIATDEQYPQFILIEFNQDKCDLLNNWNVGQPVKVSINIRGREWINPQGEAKYFNQINGWRIEAQEGTAPTFSPPPAETFNAVPFDPNTEEHDDLPF